jgi:sugar lactone lactonase YvrE
VDARSLAVTLAALGAVGVVTGCGPTEIVVGDVPGLARIVAGVAGQPGTGAAQGSALAEPLAEPMGVAAGPNGVFYIADTFNRVIRRVEADLSQRIIAGNPSCTTFAAAPAPTTPDSVCFGLPTAVALDPTGSVVVVADQSRHVVWRLDLAAGTARVILGTGTPGRASDSALAVVSPTSRPTDVAVDANGGVFVAELANSRVVWIEPPAAGGAERVFVIAGRDLSGYAGDGGAARFARMFAPQGIALAGDTLYIADTGNHVVRRVIGGIIETVAGTGQRGYAGDGGQATAALLDTPTRVVRIGSLVLIADRGSLRVRSFSPTTGLMATFLGTGDSTLGPDQQDAAATPTALPEGLAAAGPHAYLADAGHHVIRRILVP